MKLNLEVNMDKQELIKRLTLIIKDLEAGRLLNALAKAFELREDIFDWEII